MKKLNIITFQVMLGIMFLAVASVSIAGTGYLLKDFGSFHIGGRTATLTGLPVKEVAILKGVAPIKIDPNGDYAVEQMYVQYFIPQKIKSKYPLMLWHGGGLTGVSYETKPDGKPGWLHYFLGAGHAVYISDAVERGRASWASFPEIFTGAPLFRTKKESWEYFRIGPKGSYETKATYPGALFPVDSFDQFCKQGVPRWASTNDAIQAAYDELVKKVGACVLLAHSQGTGFAIQAALNASDKVKAIIVIEPTAVPKPGPDLDKLKNIPVLIMWGDYLNEPNLALGWPSFTSKSADFAKDLKDRGGKVDFIELPKIGIKGNDHMLMMDTNSDQIAELIQKWMKTNKL